MAEIIKLEEVEVDRDAEILALAIDYHKDLCGCTNYEDDLVVYIDRITKRYDEGEFS
jgi:hypothetical protein